MFDTFEVFAQVDPDDVIKAHADTEECVTAFVQLAMEFETTVALALHDKRMNFVTQSLFAQP